MMEHRIEMLPETTLVGLGLTMSFANNRTGELWQRFMSRRNEIAATIGAERYSVQIYPPTFFESFHPEQEFKKWAAVCVSESSLIPEGMEKIILPAGLYVVFHYNGSSADAPRVFAWIFGEWLPASAYELDDRPHFEILGEKYRNNHPDSEEEIWIPIKRKGTNP
ncbi:GyrI-like domain-containing protein [Mangrovibacterium diazotrophicum]|uniref:AraC family transcriptional regulator n=1 Tax=Mangrovibacterium diazotrophicum TaxID=1261403 RepID=A0A419W8F7_9BACT|nr:GyrI-like domain-containing protein [Mangrovibacterium diazotrophicum]RKD91735.1 AraC family transcriptional regulator [Mangrovibacterium diazotrophicum]